ncbi:MAG: hypothetical protein HGA54_10115 [Actinobacteria bacterium]|nr:hypothetical protein [Actinomycetota bacterium]
MYTKDEYRERVAAVRAAVPQVTLTTDIIAGFPGESDEDFEESFEFCREMRFSKLHVFRYSRRPGTPAASRDDQVPAQTSAHRGVRLRELGHEMRIVEARSRVGTSELILIEAGGKAKSESYFDCRFTVQIHEDSRFRCGALVSAQIVAVEDDVLICKPTFQ